MKIERFLFLCKRSRCFKGWWFYKEGDL